MHWENQVLCNRQWSLSDWMGKSSMKGEQTVLGAMLTEGVAHLCCQGEKTKEIFSGECEG